LLFNGEINGKKFIFAANINKRAKMNEEDWDDSSIKEFTDLQKFAYVTLRAIENDHVGYCYRENGELKIDSGWRFLFGDEDEDYLDNPDNSITKDLKEIVEWKPAIGEILKAYPGQDFEWNEEIGKFEKI
jgi:hypothetical protein